MMDLKVAAFAMHAVYYNMTVLNIDAYQLLKLAIVMA